MLTVEEKNLVQSSFQDVVPIAQEVGETFYARLFEIAPEVKPLFKEDIKSQSKKLMQMISYAVTSLDNLEVLVPQVKELGNRHVGYGVSSEHYGLVAQALLWTLEKYLGDKFDEATKGAWTKVYTILAETMQSA
jgi:hemoglobin-like flavoprotein